MLGKFLPAPGVLLGIAAATVFTAHAPSATAGEERLVTATISGSLLSMEAAPLESTVISKTLATGFVAPVGALTLSSNSSTPVAGFENPFQTIDIDNGTGTANTVGNGATDRLIFDVSQSSNLNSFSFTGYAGATQFDLGNGYYEVAPLSAVPEPSTYVAGALALGALCYHQRKRLRRHRTRRWLAER